MVLEIRGYADPTPIVTNDRDWWDAQNQRLSEWRAEAVRDLLVEKGVSPGRIKTKGEGYHPNAKPDRQETWVEGRRVDFYFGIHPIAAQ